MLRVTAVIGVVIIHAMRPLSTNRTIEGWQAASVMDLMFVWAVPVFVMISGALVLDRSAHAAGPAAFYRRRFARILPPLIAWNLIYLTFVRYAVEQRPVSLTELRVMAVDGNFYGALWFLWIIVGLYLVAPILAAFLTDDRRRALITGWAFTAFTAAVFVMAGVTQLWGQGRPEALTILTQWWPFVGLFVLGLAYRDTMPRRAKVAALTLAGVALLALVVWQYIAVPRGYMFQLSQVAYYGAAVMVASVCVFVVGNTAGTKVFGGPRSGSSATGVLKILAEAAFGVFLCHQLILALLVRYVLAPVSFSNAVILALLTTIGAFAVSLSARLVPGVRRIF